LAERSGFGDLKNSRQVEASISESIGKGCLQVNESMAEQLRDNPLRAIRSALDGALCRQLCDVAGRAKHVLA
jgi:hypothetical protein